MGNTQAVLTIDNFIKISIPERLKDPLLEVRRRLDAVFESWISSQSASTGSAQSVRNGEYLLKAVGELLKLQDEKPDEDEEDSKAKLAAALAKAKDDSATKQAQAKARAQVERKHKAAASWGGGWAEFAKKQ